MTTSVYSPYMSREFYTPYRKENELFRAKNNSIFDKRRKEEEKKN